MKTKIFAAVVFFLVGVSAVTASQFTEEGLSDQQESVSSYGALGRLFDAKNF